MQAALLHEKKNSLAAQAADAHGGAGGGFDFASHASATAPS